MTSVERYEKASAVLDEYIREHKLRHTLERERLLRMIADINEPIFTVHDIEIKRKDAHISLPTLYNSLNLFVSARILYRLERTQGVTSEQYKWALDAKNTLRVICTRCGREATFTDRALLRIVQERKYANFVPAHFSLYVYGTCKTCRRLLIQKNKKQ
jgi:Fe2+/Zn2+ uptake regulation proteins